MESPRQTSFGSTTSVSLLIRVRDGDSLAWSKLEHVYKPMVYGWCRSNGAPESDILDVVQEVLLGVSNRIGSFSRDRHGAFRGWLWRVTRNKLIDFLRKRGRQVNARGGDEQDWLHQIPEELPPESNDNLDSQGALLRRALDSIEQDFPANDWQAFYRMTVDGDSAREIADDQGRSVKAVRQAKYRVLRRLRQDYGDLGDFL